MIYGLFLMKKMEKINENDLAKRVAEIEGKNKRQDIAQIKETIKNFEIT